MFKFHMRKTFNSKQADFRKVKHETIEEFVARGGKIKKIPQPSPGEILDKRAKQQLFEE